MGVLSFGFMCKSSIFEFLMDVVFGWCVDEFFNFVDCNEQFNLIDFFILKMMEGEIVVEGDYDWIVDLSLFEVQMFFMYEVF